MRSVATMSSAGFAGRQRHVVDVTNFAAAIERQTFECCFEQGSSGEHSDLARRRKSLRHPSQRRQPIDDCGMMIVDLGD